MPKRARPLVRHALASSLIRRSGVLWVRSYQLELVGQSTKLGKRMDVQLPHRPAAMDLHRGISDADVAVNVFSRRPRATEA
jgi:hypothetical protein